MQSVLGVCQVLSLDLDDCGGVGFIYLLEFFPGFMKHLNHINISVLFNFSRDFNFICQISSNVI